jgi:hypothetical protein
VRDQFGEAHQIEEELIHPATLGGLAAADGCYTLSPKPDDPLLLGDGMHLPHRVALDETCELALEGGEVTGLDFDELSAADELFKLSSIRRSGWPSATTQSP